MEEDDMKVFKDIAKKGGNLVKKLLKSISLKKWILIGVAVILVIILIGGLAWAEELITFQDTSKAIRKGSKIKVKGENGEEIEIDVENINDLIEIKGDSEQGYYLQVNYLNEYLDQVMKESHTSYDDIGIREQKELLKKMIMAEFTTQYPDVTFGYPTAGEDEEIDLDSDETVEEKIRKLTDDNDKADLDKNIFKGSIHIKRTSLASTSGDVFAGQKYDLTEDEITKLATLAYGEAGGDLQALKDCCSHMANLYEMYIYRNPSSTKSIVEFVSTTSWYDSRSWTRGVSEEAKEAVRECIVDGNRTMPLYINEFCTFASQYISPYYSDTSRYVQGETRVTQLFAGNPTGTYWCVSGGNIYFYTDEDYKNYIETTYGGATEDSKKEDEEAESVSGLSGYLMVGDSYFVALRDQYKLLGGATVCAEVGKAADYWLNHFDQIEAGNPKGIIVSLGINNYNSVSEMKQLLDKLHEKYENVPIFVLKVFHVGENYTYIDKTTMNNGIDGYNTEIQAYCAGKGYNFIDATEGLINSNGYLDPATSDGIHIDTLAANSKFYNNIIKRY